MGLQAVKAAVKNPAHAARLKSQLTEVANDIYFAYGMVPPVEPEAK